MNVAEIIFTELKNRGCKIEEESGIIYVTTPGGEVWDFTMPLKQPDCVLPEHRGKEEGARSK